MKQVEGKNDSFSRKKSDVEPSEVSLTLENIELVIENVASGKITADNNQSKYGSFHYDNQKLLRKFLQVRLNRLYYSNANIKDKLKGEGRINSYWPDDRAIDYGLYCKFLDIFLHIDLKTKIFERHLLIVDSIDSVEKQESQLLQITQKIWKFYEWIATGYFLKADDYLELSEILFQQALQIKTEMSEKREIQENTNGNSIEEIIILLERGMLLLYYALICSNNFLEISNCRTRLIYVSNEHKTWLDIKVKAKANASDEGTQVSENIKNEINKPEKIGSASADATSDHRGRKDKEKVDEDEEIEENNDTSLSVNTSWKFEGNKEEYVEENNNESTSGKTVEDDKEEIEHQNRLIRKYVKKYWPKEVLFCDDRSAGFPAFKKLLDDAFSGEQEAIENFYKLIFSGSQQRTSLECRRIFKQKVKKGMEEGKAHAFLLYFVSIYAQYLYSEHDKYEIENALKSIEKKLSLEKSNAFDEKFAKHALFRKDTNRFVGSGIYISDINSSHFSKALLCIARSYPKLGDEIRVIGLIMLLARSSDFLTRDYACDRLIETINSLSDLFGREFIYWKFWTKLRFDIEYEFNEQALNAVVDLVISSNSAHFKFLINSVSFATNISKDQKQKNWNEGIELLDNRIRTGDPGALIDRARLHFYPTVELFEFIPEDISLKSHFKECVIEFANTYLDWKRDCHTAVTLLVSACKQSSHEVRGLKLLEFIWNYLKVNNKLLLEFDWLPIITDLYKIGHERTTKKATAFLIELVQLNHKLAKAHFIVRHITKNIDVKGKKIEKIYNNILREVRPNYFWIFFHSNKELASNILTEIEKWLCNEATPVPEQLNDAQNLIDFINENLGQYTADQNFSEVYQRILARRVWLRAQLNPTKTHLSEQKKFAGEQEEYNYEEPCILF